MQASIQQKKELLSALAFYISKRVELNFSKLKMNRVSITLYDVVKSTGEVKDVFRFVYGGTRLHLPVSLRANSSWTGSCGADQAPAGRRVPDLYRRCGVPFPSSTMCAPPGRCSSPKRSGAALQVQVADNTGVPKAA